MDIVDALVLTVGLDASKFVKGQKEIAQSLKKTKETSIADGKAIETSMTAASAGVGKLVAAFLGLTAVFTGGKQVGKFMEDVTRGDATLGRFANNLRMSAKDLQSWQGAVESVGGAASDVTSSVQGLSDSFQALKTFGDPGIVKALAVIGTKGGKRIDINKPINSTLLDLADDLSKIAKTDPAQASYLGRQIGLNQNLINVLIKGRAETEKLLAIQAKYAASTADIDAAEKRQSAWQRLAAAGESFGRTILTAVTPALLKLNDLLRQFVEWAKSQLPAVQKAFEETFGSLDQILANIEKTLGKPNWKEWFETIKGWGKEINNVAQWLGGWGKTLEYLLGLAVLNWLAPIVTSFGLLTGYILSLVGAGPALAALFAVGGPLAALAGLYGLVRPQPLNGDENEIERQKRYGQHGSDGGAGGGFGGHVEEPGAHYPPYSGGTGAHRGQRSLLLGGAHGGGNPGGGAYNVQKAYDLIKKAGGSDEEARTLAAIAQAESSGNPGAHNTRGKDDSYGLWQINMRGKLGPERRAKYGLKSDEDLKGPETNARVALQMAREAHGYKDWSTYNSGAYRQYLSTGGGQSQNTASSEWASAKHPARYQGKMKIGDETFDYASGSSRMGRGSSPFGSHPITGFDPSALGGRGGGAFRTRDVYDPQVHDKRGAVEIHMSNQDDVNRVETHGCFGIPRVQWPRAKAALQKYLKEHPGGATLMVSPNGEASIVPRGGLRYGPHSVAPENFSRPQSFIPPVGAATASHVAHHNSTVNSHNTTASHEVHVGAVNVHTSPNSDASGIVRDIKPALERASFASLGNYSLA